jgi:hypothetical protein
MSWERRAPIRRHGRVNRRCLLLLLVLFVTACEASPAPSGAPGPSLMPTAEAEAIGPTRICDRAPDEAGLLLSCTEAIGGVLLALGPDALSVRAAWFRPGAPCPPNARCFAPPPGSAYVVIRLEDGRVGLVRFAGEAFVGELEDPTYDVWPASGVPVPPIGRPDVGPGAPAEVANREALSLCGEERVGVFDRHAGRNCFLGAVQDGRSAELASQEVDPAGEPVVVLYRYGGRGPVLVYRSASPAGPGWVRSDCAIGSAFDDELIFVVQECIPTALS